MFHLTVCDDSMMSECSELHNRIPSPTASDSSDDLDDEIEEDEEMDDDYEEEDDDDDDDTKRNNKSNNSLNKKSNFNSSSSSGADKRNNTNPTNTANKLSSFLDMTFWRKWVYNNIALDLIWFFLMIDSNDDEMISGKKFAVG